MEQCRSVEQTMDYGTVQIRLWNSADFPSYSSISDWFMPLQIANFSTKRLWNSADFPSYSSISDWFMPLQIANFSTKIP